MKCWFHASTGLPAALPRERRVVGAAGRLRDGRDGRDPLPQRSRRSTRSAPTTAGELVDARAAGRRCRASSGSPSRPTRRLVAGRVSLGVEYDLRKLLFRQLQSLELAFFDHQQTGQLMSRVTVDLQSIRFFLGYGLVFMLQSGAGDRAGRDRDVRDPPGARGDRPDPGAVRRLRHQPLQPPRPAGAAGGAAADRRADRGRRGEHLRRARRQGVRARGAPARALRAQRVAGSSTSRWSRRDCRRATTR